MTDPLENVFQIIKSSLPDASDEQIRDAFISNSGEIALNIIKNLENELPDIIEELNLPTDADVRLDYAKATYRAKRSRENIRAGLMAEAESTKRLVSELRTWQRYHAERGNVQKADDYAKNIAEFENASSTKERIFSCADNDVTCNIIIREERSEERGIRSIRKLEELISDVTQK